jgi:hypothetical protein
MVKTAKKKTKETTEKTGIKIHQTELRKVKELKQFEQNPRTITKDMFEKLCQSIQDSGFVEPLVIDETNRVLGGHQRLKAAKRLGLLAVPCCIVDLKGDEQKAKLLNLRLNRIQGEFDYEILFKFLSDDLDPALIERAGFDSDEVEEITRMMQEADSAVEHAMEEATEKTRVAFEATEAKGTVPFKFGSFKAHVPTEYYDKFNVIYDTLFNKGIVKSEVQFSKFVVKATLLRMRKMIGGN